jgi:hypothetical protein
VETLTNTNLTASAVSLFDQEARASFTGRFHGPHVQLRLKPEGQAWTGSVVIKATTYPVRAKLQSGKMQGTFGQGEDSWPFSATSDGDHVRFTTEAITESLQR